ncbi:MAG: hypothetical protein ACREJM_08060 [Candidatus Saccharimonadales bacterium]
MSKFVKADDRPELTQLAELYVALENAQEAYKHARGQCAQSKSEFETWRDKTGLRDSRSYGTTLKERFGEYLAWALREANTFTQLSVAHRRMAQQLPLTRSLLSRCRRQGFFDTRKGLVTLNLNFAEACDLFAETKLLLERRPDETQKPFGLVDPFTDEYLQSRFDEASEICSRLCPAR